MLEISDVKKARKRAWLVGLVAVGVFAIGLYMLIFMSLPPLLIICTVVLSTAAVYFAWLCLIESYCHIWCLSVFHQAATWLFFVTSIPSLNLTPVMTFAK